MSDNKRIILDPFGATVIEDYERLFTEFEIQPFKPSFQRYQTRSWLCVEALFLGIETPSALSTP
ncbi:MAG: hypothetical protein QW323_03040 [Candidatus Bathyarchaeia archaeon]